MSFKIQSFVGIGRTESWRRPDGAPPTMSTLSSVAALGRGTFQHASRTIALSRPSQEDTDPCRAKTWPTATDVPFRIRQKETERAQTGEDSHHVELHRVENGNHG